MTALASTRFPFKRVVIVVLAIVFVAWITFLLFVGASASRNPVFIDGITGNDVSGGYTSIIPLERYIIEPLVGFAIIIADDLTNATYLFLALFIIARIGYLLVARVILKQHHRKEIVLHPARSVVNFFWKYAILALGTAIIILAIGFAIQGFLFINNMFMRLLQIAVLAAGIMLAVKIVQVVVDVLHPSRSLKVKPQKPWARQPRTPSRYWKHKIFDTMGRETRYAISMVLMFVFANLALSSIALPTQRIETSLGENEYLIDFHVHTSRSDGTLSPAARVRWYMDQGIHAAAFSDHDNLEGALEASAYVEQHGLNFTVIIAQEYSAHNIHLNIYGLTQQYAPIAMQNDALPHVKFMNVSDMIQDVKANGGFVIVNHYARYTTGDPPSKEDLLAWGVDGFEIINKGSVQGNSSIRQFCLDNGLAAISASDEHGNVELSSFMKVSMPGAGGPSNLTALFDVLKQNTHQAIRVNYYLNQPARLDRPFRALSNMYNYFFNLDGTQLASWLAWSIAGFTLVVVMMLAWNRIIPQEVAGAIVEDESKRSLLFKGCPRAPAA